jgi:hypothetical protein
MSGCRERGRSKHLIGTRPDRANREIALLLLQRGANFGYVWSQVETGKTTAGEVEGYLGGQVDWDGNN